jgi:hypothetical protein
MLRRYLVPRSPRRWYRSCPLLGCQGSEELAAIHLGPFLGGLLHAAFHPESSDGSMNAYCHVPSADAFVDPFLLPMIRAAASKPLLNTETTLSR